MARDSRRKQGHDTAKTHNSAESSVSGKSQIADNRPAVVAQLRQQQALNKGASNRINQGQQPTNHNQAAQAKERAPAIEGDLTQLVEKEGTGPEGLQSTHQQQASAGNSHTIQSKSKVVQRLSIFQKIKKFLSVKSVTLGLEGLGHIVAGIVAVAAGGATAASLVGVAPGTVAIVGGVGQILIGVSKWVRAAIVGWANAHNEDGKPSKEAKAWIDGLTAFEAAIGVSSAVVTAGAAALVGTIISGMASLIKLIRAAMSGVLNKKLPGWVVALEGAMGVFGSLGSIIGKGAAGAVDLIKMLVNSIKTFRGVATAEQAAAPEETEADGEMERSES